MPSPNAVKHHDNYTQKGGGYTNKTLMEDAMSSRSKAKNNPNSKLKAALSATKSGNDRQCERKENGQSMNEATWLQIDASSKMILCCTKLLMRGCK